ncbi:Zinc finger (C3HC4-type RING finger) family protein [Striga hermonthica]|uniref:Zinc finger (C3HC4-type RING finger) family protein n=1 Tax=Striga hermonthica TaxID=68872 RepID=A0A9N7NZ23_STRHE|nr:Zinc finger (C3HC4-type RING finger) family protein [Striga hermonthica]
MVLGWRRAFCTSIRKDQERDSAIIRERPDPVPRIRSTRLGGFFSEPSTPRLQSRPVSPTLRCRTTAAAASAPPCEKGPQSPKLHCKTKNSPRFFHRSAPSSPRSPSTFSVLKSSLRLSKSRCGVCLQSVKTGQGTAIFTAECGHSFHFPCITAHMEKRGSLTCPICSVTWKEMHLLTAGNRGSDSICPDLSSKNDKRCVFKVYNDDEPLSSPSSGALFNPILESDETEEENDDFPGFFPAGPMDTRMKSVEVALLSEAAVVSVGKTSETYAVVLKIKAPASAVRRAPVDLVTVLNVSRNMTPDKLRLMRRALRKVVSSLSAADRLSIVAFSTASKRLLPLRRMSTTGRRSARRIIDAVVALDDVGGPTSAADALKKAVKVLDDRRERNATAGIMLLTDGHRGAQPVTSTRKRDIAVHSVNLSAWLSSPADEAVGKCIVGLIGDVVQDLRVQLGFAPGSAPGEIAGVYSYAGRPAIVGSGSGWCRVGDLHSEEERELLIELIVPSSLSLGGARRQLSVRCSYKDPSTHQTICDKVERPLTIPRPRAVGSSTRDIQRLRCLFVTTRAVAESRRMAERDDVVGAHHTLASARALVLQSGSGSGSEFVRGLEAELAELNWRRGAAEKVEPLTPTSAWRAAERLAKVAIMRKSLNRVSDLHGFENARF